MPVSPARMNRGPPTPIVTSGCDGLLDLEAIRRDGLLAVGVGDLDVVQAVRRAGQVELGDDLGAVHEIR